MRAERSPRPSDARKRQPADDRALDDHVEGLDAADGASASDIGWSLAEGLIGLRHWPVMIVDQKARVAAANLAARRLLEEKACWSLGPNGELRGAGPGTTADLQMKIREISYAVPPSRTRLAWTVSKPDAHKMLVVLSRLWKAPPCGGPLFSTPAPVLITLHGGQPAGSPIEQQILVDAFDFTPAEARLALALLEGHTLKSYAAVSGIKISTVRWHLSNALDKSGSAGQRDLVRLMAWLIAL